MRHQLDKLREKRANGEGGFTLIELLVVVVIIGILIAIAIPLYLNYKKGASDKSAQSDVRNAISTLETCNSDNGSYPLAGAAGGVALTGSLTALGCATQSVTKGSSTTLTYFSNPATGTVGTTTVTAYMLVGVASDGNVTGGTSGFYCYSSSAGGSVAKKTITALTAYSSNCTATP